MSGRHRAVALDLISQYLGVNTEDVRLKVTSMVFQNVEQLCMSCVIYNTNRTMNKTERDDLVLTSKSGSLALFDRVSNVTTLKKSFGIELADTMLQNLPDTKILRNSFNVLFTRFLPILEKEVDVVYRALLSQDRDYFDKGMSFVRTILEEATNQGVFNWDGKVNFQRELAPKILLKLQEITKQVTSEDIQEVASPPKRQRKTAKAKEVKNEVTHNETNVERPIPAESSSVQSTEFDEW